MNEVVHMPEGGATIKIAPPNNLNSAANALIGEIIENVISQLEIEYNVDVTIPEYEEVLDSFENSVMNLIYRIQEVENNK